MSKDILMQYVDACEMVREEEKRIRRLESESREVVSDVVKGSMSEFPFAQQTYHLEGLPAMEQQMDRALERLSEYRARAQATKIRVETWMTQIPLRMRRIIQYKFFEDLTWGQVAVRMGRKSTADSVRMEFQRFMNEKK